MSVYSATTVDQLLSYSLKPGSQCTVSQSPANSNTLPVNCDDEWISTEAVDRCNVTGLWSQFDADVERACLSVEGRSSRVQHVPYETSDGPTLMYKNIFCAICNMRDYPQYGYCTQRRPQDLVDWEEPQLRIFSFLLGFGSNRRAFAPEFIPSFTFSTCSEGEWSAPDGSCMDLQCSPGKTLDGNSCVTALDQIRGLSYQIQLWFVPAGIPDYNIKNTSPKSTQRVIFGALFEQIIGPLMERMHQMSVDYGFLVSHEPSDDDDVDSSAFRPPNALWVAALVEAQEFFSRDWFESYLVDSLRTATVQLNISNVTMEYQFKPFPAQPPIVSDLCLESGIHCYKKREHFGLYSIFKPSHFIQTNELLNCPFIMFNKTVFGIGIYQDTEGLLPDISVTLKIGKATLNFTTRSELSSLDITEDNNLIVCRDILDLKLKELEEEERREFYSKTFVSKADESTKAQYYMTLGCVSVSMACLVLTLFTYFRFRVLRSAAGMNNIFLCSSLLLAQAALLTSVHISGPQTLCTVMGMLTHFLWLWMFVWSFICCFHMFRVFTAKTRTSCPERSQTIRFVWTVVLSVTAPAVNIGVVVSASHFTSGGSRIGYGHSSCYLDSSLLIGVATVLPLAFVSFANIVFFAITVATIHKVRKLQSHDSFRKEDLRNLYVYVKLSTMTGAFWMIQILAEAVDFDTLRFLAIILNGLQGTFIFFSYIWNKRVLNLHLRSLGFKPVTLTSSETQRRTGVSTLGAVKSQIRKSDKQNKPSTISEDSVVNQDFGMDEARRGPISHDGDRNIKRKSLSSSSQSSGVHSEPDACYNDDACLEEIQAREIARQEGNSDVDGRNGSLASGITDADVDLVMSDRDTMTVASTSH
ncbi:G-protein coupled receptor Mth [Elysia marginata]|uniref:G-protein coupled receptor Mth n=1 Tax=Elysia marginata TaxID=1093978 RepID=A0AAV4H9L4_9GAST|nr:G-protein coupled receptor Mth [Elysia marginata]